MNEVEIKACFDKIAGSKVFSRSNIHKVLLKYLLEATLKGENPKEFTIAVDVFNHSANASDTSNVRVHIHNLRKKLESYYTHEGAKDAIYFTIPKGAYSLEFKDKKSIPGKRSKNKIRYFVLFLALISISAFSIFLKQKSDNDKLKNTAFWQELLTSNKKTIIVAGDFFTFHHKKMSLDYNREWNIRDVRINSNEQLLDFLNSTDSLAPEDFPEITDATYMSREALFSMQYIIPLLIKNHVEFQFTLSSSFNWETFSDMNVIYIGPFKNLKAMTFFTDKLNLKYDVNKYEVSFENDANTNTYSSTYRDGTNIDYAVVSKMPGPNNSVIYLFISDNDIGCIESVKHFTKLDNLKNFEKTNLKGVQYFKSIFKAEGVFRTGVNYNLVEYYPITDSTIKNSWYP